MDNTILLEKDFDLRAFNSFGVSAYAKYFARFHSVEMLSELLQLNTINSHNNPSGLLILGAGSNVLFTKDFDGPVLKNEIKGIELLKEGDDLVYLKAGAGENWHGFVQYCIQKNLAGVENLSLIPGNVGASPMQNIGAYGVEIKDVFHSLEAYDIEDKKIVTFGLTDCEFGYRESIFKNKYRNRFVITSVTYRLSKKPSFNISYGAIQQQLEAMGVQQLSIANISEAVIRIRQSKLPNPAEIGNAGSFFKNPEIENDQFEDLKKQYPNLVGYPLQTGKTKLAAGWLIEHCGPPHSSLSWKGYRVGDAGCHSRQALVLVNYGHANGSEIFKLSTAIIQSVKEKFSVQLHREVNIY